MQIIAFTLEEGVFLLSQSEHYIARQVIRALLAFALKNYGLTIRHAFLNFYFQIL
jgi:hypothetical protein